ncbi:interleukin-8-like [Narcine bancroftii]|uniref:interleukin-8-like n=1 Tax=Narcine bancroftii TaxID=1343680 RepID=UPI003831B9D0
MNCASTMTILILLLQAFAARGIPIIAFEGRCRCIQFTSEFINLKSMWGVRYIPRGFNCERPEIIVRLKNGKKICVDPNAKWVKILFKVNKRVRPQT